MAWRDIPVTIRRADSGKRQRFGVCDHDDFDDIIRQVQRWGTTADGEGFGSAVGNFDPDSGSFEVVLVED